MVAHRRLGKSANQNQWFIAWMIVYGLSIAFAKCAILLLYVRVFTTFKKTFTITACIVGFVVILIGLANIFGAIFQCSPRAFAWNKSIKEDTALILSRFLDTRLFQMWPLAR